MKKRGIISPAPSVRQGVVLRGAGPRATLETFRYCIEKLVAAVPPAVTVTSAVCSPNFECHAWSL